jgi:Dolichol phosphate-mannose biosynthesis regulatory protein (DPM2)
VQNNHNKVAEAKSSVMASSDKVLGLLLIITAALIFTYYTLWVLVTVSFDNASLT